MLKTQIAVPEHLAELTRWFIDTVTPLVDENGWSVNVNGNAGTVETDVRRTAREATETGERRTDIRVIRRFRLKSSPRPRGIGVTQSK